MWWRLARSNVEHDSMTGEQGDGGKTDVPEFDLFDVLDASINMSVWATAVGLQRQRLRENYGAYRPDGSSRWVGLLGAG